MKDKIKQIRERCVGANPELKGCCAFHTIFLGGEHAETRKTCESCVLEGRPIRLEDIVFTLMKVLFNGNQYDAMGRKEIHDLLRLWRFGESFENQSDPTKEFIWKLLCSEEK